MCGQILKMKSRRFGMNLSSTDQSFDASQEAPTKTGFGIFREAIYLTIGGIYRYKHTDHEYQLLHLIDANQATFKNLTTLRNEILSVHDFINIRSDQGTTVQVQADEISDEDWQKAQQRYLAIKPLMGDSDIRINSKDGKFEKWAQECGVSTRTLRRWIVAYESTYSIASLLDKKRGWVKGNRRLSDQMRNLIDVIIQEHYLTIQRPSVEATIRKIFKRCNELEWEKPSKNAIRYQIERIPEKEYLKKRGYRERAKNKFTPKAGQFPQVNYPLAVVQIDHTPVDIILVDDKYRKPIGRPYITLAIDIYSRMITGYYISLDAPSVTSVAMCLSRSILPKNELLLEYGLTKATWDAYGIPQKIHVDNGSDFRSASLRKSCALHGIGIEFRPLARPEYGGHIERLIGNLMHKVHELPGTTFSNIKQRDGYDSEKNAALTLEEFERWFLNYVTRIYHQSIHSGIGRTPNDQWHIGLFGDGFEPGIGLPAIPADAQTLTLDFMPGFKRTIQHTGVVYNKIHYYDPCLNNLIKVTDANSKKTKEFSFKQDPRDISHIWFFDSDLRQYFKIPYANQALPVMSLWEYNQLYRMVKAKHNTVNESLIYQAWEDIQNLVEEAQKSTKTLRRHEQRRKTHLKSQTIYQSNETSISLHEEARSISSDINNQSTANDTQDDDMQIYFEDIE